MQDDTGPRLKPLLWGAFFIVLGGVLLFQRFVGLEMTEWWDLWPAVFLVIGTAHLLDRKPGGAATMFAFAFWFFAVEFRWFGMTYRNSWPLALIAIGIGSVIRAISGEESSRREKREKNKPFMRMRIEHQRRDEEVSRDDTQSQDMRTEEPR
jgi:hypothetical protein